MGLNQVKPPAPPEVSPAQKPWTRWLLIAFGVTFILWLASTLLYNWTRSIGWQTYTSSNSGLDNGIIQTIMIDKQDRVWVGTDSGLSMLYPDGSWVTYKPGNSTPVGIPVLSLAIDSEERVWVGTKRGLYLLSPDGKWLTSTYNLALKERDQISALVSNDQGAVWAGTIDNGLYAISTPGREYHYNSFRLVNDMAVDSQEQVWVGTNGGLKVLRPLGGIDTFTTYSGLISNKITSLVIDDQERVWAGTPNGLSVLSPEGVWISFKIDDTRMKENYVRDLAIDSQERIWALSRVGLSVLNPDGSWTTYTNKNSGLVSLYAPTMSIDSQDRIWVGFYSSVHVMDPTSSVHPKIINSILVLRDLFVAFFVFETVGGILIWNRHRKARRALINSQRKEPEPAPESDDVEYF